ARSLPPARRSVPRRHARSRRITEYRRAAAAHRRGAAVSYSRSRLRSRARLAYLHSAWTSGSRAGWRRALRRDGQAERLRGLAPGSPPAATPFAAIRRHLRQCRAVPCAQPGVAACADPALGRTEARWRAVLLQSARREPGGLEWQALRRLV